MDILISPQIVSLPLSHVFGFYGDMNNWIDKNIWFTLSKLTTKMKLTYLNYWLRHSTEKMELITVLSEIVSQSITHISFRQWEEKGELNSLISLHNV